MNAKKLKKRLKFTDAQLEKIRQAVIDAEKKSDGEITLALTSESASYAEYELFVAVIVGLVSFCIMLLFSGALTNWLNSMTWQPKVWQLPLFMGSVSFGLIALCYHLSNFPALDRLIVPKSVRANAVYKRALQFFAESGVFATKNHTGILIFVSWTERKVKILADIGITAKISQKDLNEICFEVSKGFLIGTASSITDSFIDAINKCGVLLEKHFPASKENPNELKDNLVFVDKGLVMFNEK